MMYHINSEGNYGMAKGGFVQTANTLRLAAEYRTNAMISGVCGNGFQASCFKGMLTVQPTITVLSGN